jgi:hypothetical protein
VALTLLLACGCASYSSVEFAPKVQDVELRDGGDLEARVVVAWNGIQEREVEGEERWELVFRMRIENPSPTAPFHLASAEFELLDGALTPLGPGEARDMPASVDPGGVAAFELRFVLPAGREPKNYDLSTLSLRGSLQSGRWSWTTNFQRLEEVDHGPFWGVSFGVSV